MEHINGKSQTSKVTPEDVINILPEDVITNILNCLPIQDAVRTSILSRKWRYKWTTLTQLVFDEKFVEYPAKGRIFITGRTISRLLLQIKGFIRKFVLYIPYGWYYSMMDVEDINNCLMLLFTKGIREFTLINMHSVPLELSTHLLSCADLKHLTLHNCCLRRMTNYHGFPNLLTLEFNRVKIKDCKYGELITSCTLLEVLKLHAAELTGNVKLVEIATLENLKVLSFTLCELDNPTVTTWDVYRLMASLRKLHNLALDFGNVKFMEETSAGNRVSSALPSLTSLSLCNLNLNSRSMVLFAFDLIRCSLNLQTLKIMAVYQNPSTFVPLTSSEVECSIMGNLKQLRVVEYGFIVDSEIELGLIKSLLACCSSLEKMVLYYNEMWYEPRYYLNLAVKLIAFPRASPIAKIDLVDTYPGQINFC